MQQSYKNNTKDTTQVKKPFKGKSRNRKGNLRWIYQNNQWIYRQR